MTTIDAGFDPRRNSLNCLRLVLAVAVIVSHTWPLGGYGSDPAIAGETLGTWAVAGFFAISGYLIATSRLHLPFGTFVVRRVLRIYPGYLVCLVVVAAGFAPLSAALGSGSINWGSAASYLVDNLLLKVHQDGISHTLANAPYGPAWNGSLWTLIYEFLCYLAIGALLFVTRGRRTLVVGALVLCAAVWTVEWHAGTTGFVESFGFLGSIFLAGSLIALYADRIPLDWRLGVLGVILVVASGYLHVVPWLGAVPIAYVCLWLGIVLPFQRIGRTNDISYGVYIYAFPMQQLLLVCLNARGLPVGLAVLLSIVCTLPLAAASWFLVERRALALKGRFVRTTPAHAARQSSPMMVARRRRGAAATVVRGESPGGV
jgi:peptidoglycan/LPS O-acetylase OafA/YrhL